MTKTFEDAGFTPETVGGGAELLARYAPDGSHVWISGAEGEGMPTEDDWMICHYPADWDGGPLYFCARSTDTTADGWLANVLTAAIAKLEGKPTIDTLTTEFRLFLHESGLPRRSADELLHEDLTADQRTFVSGFVRRWDAVDATVDLDDTLAEAGVTK